MNLEKQVKEYLKVNGSTDEEIKDSFSSTVYIAEVIAFFAHRNQTRENGDYYFNHPYNCKTKYQQFVGIKEDDPFCIDIDLMQKYHIPFDGVQEVCLLHDVLEDTEVTFEEIQKVFYDYGHKNYFDLYISTPIKLITHDKSVKYDIYMEEVCKNPISAMSKLMDLIDNLNILELKAFGNKEEERAIRYVKYCMQIEDKYHFIKNVNKYCIEFNG